LSTFIATVDDRLVPDLLRGRGRSIGGDHKQKQGRTELNYR
jgi:hypothetical protein